MQRYLFSGMLMTAVVCSQCHAEDTTALLLQAACAGNGKMVARLIDEGVDVNAGGRHGGTALFLAADQGHTEVVRLLLEHGADPNRIPWPDPAAGVIAMTPLMAAAARGHTAIAELLLAHGADASIQVGETALYEQGVTAIFLATVNGHTGAAEVLTRAATSGEKLWKYMVLAIWAVLGIIIMAQRDEPEPGA
jgi:ankyrin repeat protein